MYLIKGVDAIINIEAELVCESYIVDGASYSAMERAIQVAADRVAVGPYFYFYCPGKTDLQTEAGED